jgi:hypothetical protein
MKLKSKINLVLALAILLSFVFVPSVFADGGLVIYDPDMLGWELQDMDQQLCAINYENGFENMLLSVDVSDLHGEKAVWIFPVPAKPDETGIGIIKGFPRLWGYDVIDRADETMSLTFGLMRASQIYTIPFVAPYLGLGAGMTGIEDMQEEITIHKHIEKMGLTTKLVTAKEGNAFYSYLVSKDLDLPSDLKSILGEYIGKEYSFVVSWISDIEKFKQESTIETQSGKIINSIGVSIIFPTGKIYFPLKPTSVYGNTKIPILIYVIGHVTPEIYPEIKKGEQVNYFVDDYYEVPEEVSSFFNGKTKIENLKYTKIKIDTFSRHLIEDLWIKDSAPAGVIFADLIGRHAWAGGIGFFVLSSCLASMLAGIITFRKDQPSKKEFALFGLWNFLTLIGFVVASYIGKVDNKLALSKRKIEPKKTLKEITKITLLIGLVIIIPSLFRCRWMIYLGNELILSWILFTVVSYGLFSLFIFPFVWGFYNNRKTMNFTILFSIFFLIMTFVFQIALQSVF